MESFTEAWSGVLKSMRAREDVSEAGYNVWISCIEPRSIENGEAVLFVHTNFQRKILEEHYAEKLSEAFEEVLGIRLEIRILSGEDSDDPFTSKETSESSLFSLVDSENEYSFENFIAYRIEFRFCVSARRERHIL